MNFFVKRLLSWVLIGLPVASLALNAIAWLRFGLDLPLYDDWRGYVSGQMHSLDLDYLFHPVNDTMTPVGFALDALAQRYLDGNSIAYQFLSMLVVLGGLLWLQWKLLRYALGNTQLAAACFVLTLLMLQPDTYWGQQNMAYHQALPLLFILSCLALLLSESARDIWRLPLILILSLLAGFSYISGAFGVLAVGVALLLICTMRQASALRKHLLRGGIVLTLSGVFSSAMQYWRAIPGLTTHKADAPMALPTEPDFWLFFLGKIGRSLALPQGMPWLSLAISLAVFFIVLVLMLALAVQERSKGAVSTRDYRVGIIFFVMTALVFVYLLLVSAGRTNMHPPEAKTVIQIFLYGFYRFHFFWATLLWPWLAATLIVTYQTWRNTETARLEWITNMLGLAIIPLLGVAGVFGHAAQYKAGTLYRLPTLSCLEEQLQRGEKIYCFEFFMPDFRPAYAYARSTGASFVRHFPILPIRLGTDDPAPWFRFSQDKAGATFGSITPSLQSKLPMLAGADPSIVFSTGREIDMAHCLMLDVNTKIQVSQASTSQLFYQSLGKVDFTEKESQQLSVSANTDEPQQLNFQLFSPSGFRDTLRFDPVDRAQMFNVLELEVRCRWSLPAK